MSQQGMGYTRLTWAQLNGGKVSASQRARVPNAGKATGTIKARKAKKGWVLAVQQQRNSHNHGRT